METFFSKAAGLQLVRKGMRLAPPPSLFNPLNANVDCYLTGFYMRAALAFNGLISFAGLVANSYSVLSGMVSLGLRNIESGGQ